MPSIATIFKARSKKIHIAKQTLLGEKKKIRNSLSLHDQNNWKDFYKFTSLISQNCELTEYLIHLPNFSI